MDMKVTTKTQAKPILLSEGIQATVVNLGLFFVLFQFVDLTENIIHNLSFVFNMLFGLLYITLFHGLLSRFSVSYRSTFIGAVTESIKDSLAAWAYVVPIVYLVTYLILKLSSGVLYNLLA